MRPCQRCGCAPCRCGWPSQKVEEKPPLGLMPRYIWIDERKKEIIRAMDRYSSANMVIPREWIEELANL